MAVTAQELEDLFVAIKNDPDLPQILNDLDNAVLQVAVLRMAGIQISQEVEACLLDPVRSNDIDTVVTQHGVNCWTNLFPDSGATMPIARVQSTRCARWSIS
jgi:hypothetical protein